MASEVYSSTTVSNPKDSCFQIPSEYLDLKRFILKICEVVLSFVAFLLEELVTSCSNCSALYFFEFCSCTAFFFTVLLLFLLSTSLHRRLGITCWPQLDFVYTAVIAFMFFIASVILASAKIGLDLEKAAVAFGFLVSFLFLLDVGLFWKEKGFPFKRGDAGSPGSVEVPPESEKLSSVVNGNAE
ncbi:CKLF-like MARVEL transmembrane domain-containing protein 6 [Gouania willdenowi]|uniref:MARVEL domain-containing protein n=1 Tax=Gouania willdenowi TaxID=441366 RepID=A0A8C5DAV7_GOUWI|nr:CKLF-like MARVEL transmembrane domain-containing protein 6 [Gouania willdenowi]